MNFAFQMQPPGRHPQPEKVRNAGARSHHVNTGCDQAGTEKYKKIIQTVPTIKVSTFMSDFPAALAPFYIAVPFVKA